VPIDKSERKSFFPAIEKKHGLPMSYWHEQMKKLSSKKYPEQIAFLKENHGFSQTHANALVMFSRGSKSSKRFDTLEEYLATASQEQVNTVKKIFKTIKTKYPKLDVVIAWNQPMLKLNDKYVFGVNVLRNHILIAPWSAKVIKNFTKELEDYKVNKKTIQVPSDWKVDTKLLEKMIKAILTELGK